MEPRRSQGGRRGTPPGRLKRLRKWHPCPPHVACDLERVQKGAKGCNWGAILPGAISCCLLGRREADSLSVSPSLSPCLLGGPPLCCNGACTDHGGPLLAPVT